MSKLLISALQKVTKVKAIGKEILSPQIIKQISTDYDSMSNQLVFIILYLKKKKKKEDESNKHLRKTFWIGS